ncbi:MAG: hypothetical protein NWF01_05815 [Candidatus Bathyarchaeota archaeon]|nr:hypothetical protein [Candidatus Bathyarchaeota archaeon]
MAAKENSLPIQSGKIIAISLVVIVSFVAIMALALSNTASTPGTNQATFRIVVQSDTSWSGSIGGATASKSVQGTGNTAWESKQTMATAVIQKQTDWGHLTVKILKNGEVVAEQSTQADYGVVTVSAIS